MLFKLLVFVIYFMKTFAGGVFNLLPPDFSTHRFRSGEINNGEDYFFLGSSDGYSDNIIDLPQAPIAQGTTKYCGKYIQAPPNTTCQNMIKSYWVPMDIFLLANPSLVSVVQCDSNLEAGASYCLYPYSRWNSTIPDSGSIASSIEQRNLPEDDSTLHNRGGEFKGDPRHHMDPDYEAPSWAIIIDGILAGHLSLHYARWEWARGGASNAESGPFLEIAYWIGPRVGVQPTAQEEATMNLDQYRDRREDVQAYPRNRWVVFHLHINPETDYLQHIDGRTHLGVQRVTMFHASDVRSPNTYGSHVRVEGRDYGGENVRLGSGFSCIRDLALQGSPRNRHGLWYVGWNRPFMPHDHPIFDRLYRWGLDLYHKGYAWTPGIEPILGSYNIDRETSDIRITSRERILEQNEVNVVWRSSGYQTSFRIVVNGPNWQWFFDMPNPGHPPP